MSDVDSRFLYRLEVSGWGPNKWVKMDPSRWRPRDNCIRYDGKHDIDSIKGLVSQRLTEPLEISKPVWELGFIESFKTGETESSPIVTTAVILTIHHSMGDGFTLCHQMMRRAAPADASMTMDRCYPFQAAGNTNSNGSLSLPSYLNHFYGIYKSIVKLILLAPDKPGALRNGATRNLSDVIACDFARLPLGVSELKEIAKKASELFHKNEQVPSNIKISLNDIVVAGVCLALGDLMSRDSSSRDVTSAIWVGLNRTSIIRRPVAREDDWGNANLGASYLALPTSCEDPLEVLLKCHTRMLAMKGSPEPFVANQLMKLIGSVPMNYLWPLRHLLMDKISTSVSNFPGPAERIRFPVSPTECSVLAGNGCKPGNGVIKDVFFLVAPPMSIGPYITLISYAGHVYLSVAVADKLINQCVVSDVVSKRIPEAFRIITQEIDKHTTKHY